MPPMYSLFSSTSGRMLARVSNSYAAVRPAGPAPMMMARFSCIQRTAAKNAGGNCRRALNNQDARVRKIGKPVLLA